MADRSASGSGGVRNIRAMFEAKNEQSSPPSRGRSPAAGSESVRSNSSRPISKVRTSFVAVEKSGHFGPMLGLRKTSDAGGAGPSTDKIEEEAVDGRGKQNESIAQVTTKPREKTELIAEVDTKTVTSTNGRKPESSAVKEPKAAPVQLDGTSDFDTDVKDTAAEKNKSNGSVSGPHDGASKAPSSSTTKNKPSLPIGPKQPESAEKSATSKASSSQPQSSRQKTMPSQPKLSRAESTSKSRITAKTASPKVASPKTSIPNAAASKKLPKDSSQTAKPKSPTKPIRHRASDNDFLSRMTRPTASSSSKTHDAPTSTSSGKVPAESSTTRSSMKRSSDADSDFLSRMMRPTASSASKTHESGTSSGGERPTSSKGHKTASTPADSGFLARMMKPTASSASKTHHKQQPSNSPPQKTEPLKATRKSDILEAKPQQKKDVQVHQTRKSAAEAPSEAAESPARTPKGEKHKKPAALETPIKSPKNHPTPQKTAESSGQSSEADNPSPIEGLASASTPSETDKPAVASMSDSAAEPSLSTQPTPTTPPVSAMEVPDSKSHESRSPAEPLAAAESTAGLEASIPNKPAAAATPVEKSSSEIESVASVNGEGPETHNHTEAAVSESPAAPEATPPETVEEEKVAAEPPEPAVAHDASVGEPPKATEISNMEAQREPSNPGAEVEKEDEASVAEN